MASTTTILIFWTIFNLTHPMSCQTDDQVEELSVPKPQHGALTSTLAPTIWIGLGAILIAIITLGVSLLISKIKITAFLKRHFNESVVPDKVRRSKMPIVVDFSNQNKLVTLQDRHGKRIDYGLPG